MLRHRRWAAPFAAAACAAVFMTAVRNGFVEWDDFDNFMRSPFARLSPGAAALWGLTRPFSGHYQPLTWLSLLVDRLLWDLHPAGVHAFSALLHAAAAGLAALCAREVYGEKPRAEAAAACAALLWGLHPLRVEAVSWASERREVLAACWLLLSAYAYLRGEKRASLLSYAASLLSKPSGMLFAPMLCALDLARGRRVSWRDKIPYAVMGVAAAAIAFLAEKPNGALTGFSEYGPFERLGLASWSFCWHLGKTLWPAALSPIYPRPSSLAPLYGRFALSAALLLLVAALCARRRTLAAAGLWFAAALLPVSGLALFGPQLTADRFSYLAALGPATLAGALVLKRREAGWAAGALCALLAWRTLGQIATWHDTETMWRAALERRPCLWVAHLHLGNVFKDRGYPDAARQAYEAAVACNPSYAAGHNNLGNVLAEQGRYDEALEHLRLSERLAPGKALPNLRAVEAMRARARGGNP